MFITLTNTRIIAQTPADEKILAALKNYFLRVPYEESYVQTDREDYIAGEDVWFNVFVFDRETRKASPRSRIAYFELINPENSPVIQKRLIITRGFGPGNVLLPDTLSSGTYTLRIYTNWMKNFLPGNCFMKNINIYNPFRDKYFAKKIIYEKKLGKNLNIEFFPEGGTLLNGVSAKVGVRVLDRYQQGVPFTGIVCNNEGDSLTFFKANEFGLASFEFTPEKGQRYLVLAADSLSYLPDASDKGFSIKVDNSGKDQVSIVVSSGKSYISDTDKTFLLFIHTNSIKDFSGNFRITGDEVNIAIPKTRLSPGINHVTIFGNDGKPVCERLIYTRNNNLYDSGITGNDNYLRREKVTMELDLAKAGIKSLADANLGVSVTPANNGVYSPDMDEYLLFGTEFSNLPWEKKDYSASLLNDNLIDCFLLTAKSRWLSWDKILSDKIPPFEFMFEEDGHLLSGLLKKRNSAEIEPGSLLYLSIPSKTATFQYARVNNTGHFEFLLPADYSRKDLIVQPAAPDENITIQIESSFSGKLPGSVSYIDSVSKDLPKLASDFGASYQIGKIYGITHRIEGREAGGPVSVIRFYGKPEEEIIMDDYIRLPVMQEIFFELVPGVRLRSRKSGYDIRVFNPVDNLIYDQPPLVMIDGVIINDPEVLVNLDPEIIDKIDAIRTLYLTGDLIHYGIINVITRSGNFRNINLPEYATRISYKVADPLPEFYAPEYSDPSRKQSRIPDFRNTLYWNPSLKPDKDGKVRIEFWTSDNVAEYIVNIQGITGNGELISAKKLIKVQ